MSPEVLAILKAVGYIIGGVLAMGLLGTAIFIAFRVGVGVQELKGLKEQTAAYQESVTKSLEHLALLVGQHDRDIVALKAVAGRRAGDRLDDHPITG